MENVMIKAMPRSDKPKKVRNAGFIPGVLNGPGTTSTDVQFEDLAMNRIVAKHGTNAKLWVMRGKEKTFGFIKEVQRHPVEGKIIHVSIQLISKDQDVKMQLPIVFHGNMELEARRLQVQICKSEIEVEGKAELMPDEIIVDVSKKESGENITVTDFDLPKKIKVISPKDEIYAIIKNAKKEVVEEPEEAASVPAAE